MHAIYYWLKLGLIYLALTLLGVIVVGVVPALDVCVTMHAEAHGEASEITWKRVWTTYKQSMKETWHVSLLYVFTTLFLLWVIWFSVQFKGFIFLMSLFVQATLLVAVQLTILAFVQLRQFYTGSVWQILKLAFLQLFVSPKPNFLSFIFLALSYGVLRIFPAAVFFFAVPLWIVLLSKQYRVSWQGAGLIYR